MGEAGRLTERVLAMASTAESATDLTLSVMATEEFQKQTNEALRVGFAEALASEDVQDQAVALVHGLASDRRVQASVGQGLWRAAGYSVTPSWLLSSGVQPPGRGLGSDGGSQAGVVASAEQGARETAEGDEGGPSGAEVVEEEEAAVVEEEEEEEVQGPSPPATVNGVAPVSPPAVTGPA